MYGGAPQFERLQVQVLDHPADTMAWDLLARHILRHGGGWEACTRFKCFLAGDLSTGDRAAFVRQFFQRFPGRADLVFQHHQGTKGGRPIKGTLGDLIYSLGHRSLWLEALGTQVPWSGIRALRWALECVLHSCGMSTLWSWKHRVDRSLAPVFRDTLQGLYEIARTVPERPLGTPVFTQLMSTFRSSPGVERILLIPREPTHLYSRPRSAGQAYARGVLQLLGGSYGEAVENMLDVVPPSIRSGERRWHRARLWEHLEHRVPPRAQWEAGVLPDWRNEVWQETEPHLAI